MHELLLYGIVSAGRHRRILQRCILYKPQREPEEPGLHMRRGGTQNVAVKQTKQTTTAAALYYTKLIQTLSDEDFGTGSGLHQPNGQSLSADVEDGEEPKWSMRWEDMPDTGDRGVSIRFTNTTDLLSGDPHAHMVAAGPNR
jgi:mediator of RNA polymerase II transcription subunit 18